VHVADNMHSLKYEANLKYEGELSAAKRDLQTFNSACGYSNRVGRRRNIDRDVGDINPDPTTAAS